MLKPTVLLNPNIEKMLVEILHNRQLQLQLSDLSIDELIFVDRDNYCN